MNRAHYASFYAATAVLLQLGDQYSKHSAVRAAVRRDLVHVGRIEEMRGTFHDKLFLARLEGDYTTLASIEPDEAVRQAAGAERFVARLRDLRL